MAHPDLNLLVTLDVLLTEGSVARAARRLRLSPSAMSRALARLRETTGDPLLVRAGRGLVPTPRAVELRERAGQLVEEAEAVLRPAEALDPGKLQRMFSIRARDGFVQNYGPALIERISREAPGVQLRLVLKPDKDSGPLREGLVDLEIGVIDSATGPEVRSQALLRDRFIGVVRKDHPLAEGEMTAVRYAGGRHVVVALHLLDRGPVDEALKAMGLERRIVAFVGGFSDALALARATDLIATVPERNTAVLHDSLHCFPLPLPLPDFTVSLLWHPRLDADPAHRWLRGCVRDACSV